MNRQFTKLFLFLVLLLYSCHGTQKIKYLQTNPFVKPLKSKVNMPLNIVLLEEVRDSFIMKNSLRKVKVTEFRKTIADGLIRTLQKNVFTVHVKEQVGDTGLWLVIYRIKPFWRTDSQSSSTYTVQDVPLTSNYYTLSALFQFESTLFLNAEKLTDIDILAASNTQMHSIKQAEEVFKDGLTNLCEATNKELFKHEIFQKMNTQ